jgi:copper(I)-binding protein
VRLQNRRVLGAGVLALGAALVLAGCGAGQITQTASQQPAVNGTHAQVGTIALRNAAVAYPPSGAAYAPGARPQLTLVIVNQGQQDDTLTAVSVDGAAATLGGSKDIIAGHSLVIGAAGVESTNEALPATSETPTTSAPATPTGTATSSSSQSPSTTAETPAPTGTAAAEKPGQGTITLPALTQALWPGQTIKVVFVFKNAGTVAVDLPVAAPAHVAD